ncbi:MAG: hypothetical protein RL213_1032 [Bacteroidota bacterium]|jgi:signal transduction histidine kinase
MKLLNLTNRFYIIVALALLLVSSIFLAYRVLYVVDTGITEHMLYTKALLRKQIAQQPNLQGRPFEISDHIRVDTLSRFTTFRVLLRDSSVYDPAEKAMIPLRLLTYEEEISGRAYRITIGERLTTNRDLLNGVAITLLLVAIDIIACFYFLNRYFSSSIWRPFYRALDALKRFDLQRGGKVRFEPSRVDEFNALNDELTKLTEKVNSDYRNLKEFTENMSHETQTPLAIIQSKLELLLQSGNLTPEQMEQIHSTLDAVNRLTKMNRGLILLTRIENDQYSGEEPVDFSQLIRKRMEDFDFFLQSRSLKTDIRLDDQLRVRMNPYLADILVSNLFSNAIKYTDEGGTFHIRLLSDSLEMSNSGKPPTLPDQRIFERFKRGDAPESVGLGLAIVKRICDHYHFFLSYRYSEDMHRFYVQFSKERRLNT